MLCTMDKEDFNMLLFPGHLKKNKNKIKKSNIEHNAVYFQPLHHRFCHSRLKHSLMLMKSENCCPVPSHQSVEQSGYGGFVITEIL